MLTRGASQLYLSLGDSNADGTIAIRLYHKPMVLLIWLGAVVMMLGGGLSLSDRRAAAVVAYLVTNLGIDQSRLTSRGYGKTMPIATNSTDAGRALNRRVEFKITGEKQ